MRSVRWVLGALGLAAAGYGVYGWLGDDGSRPIGQFTFLAVVLVGHDFLVLPVAIGASVLLTRLLPGWALVPAQIALFVSAAVAVVALPFVLGVGRIADNPSAFPRHYGWGVLVIVGLVWTVAAVSAVVLRARERHQ
jgi:hypothetical protein